MGTHSQHTLNHRMRPLSLSMPLAVVLPVTTTLATIGSPLLRSSVLPSVRGSSVLQWLELHGQFRLHGPRPQWEPFKTRLESAAPTILLLSPMPSRWNHS